MEPFGRKRIHGRVGLNVNGWVRVAALLKTLILNMNGSRSFRRWTQRLEYRFAQPNLTVLDRRASIVG